MSNTQTKKDFLKTWIVAMILTLIPFVIALIVPYKELYSDRTVSVFLIFNIVWFILGSVFVTWFFIQNTSKTFLATGGYIFFLVIALGGIFLHSLDLFWVNATIHIGV